MPFERLKIGSWYEAKWYDIEEPTGLAIRRRKLAKNDTRMRWHKCMVIELIPEFKIVRFLAMTRLGGYEDPFAWAKGEGYSELEARKWIPVGNVSHYCDNMLRIPVFPWVVHGYLKINRVHEVQYSVGDDEYELRYVPDAIPRDEKTKLPVFNGDHSTVPDVTSPPWVLKYYRDLSRIWSESFYSGKPLETGMLEWKQGISAITAHFKVDGMKYWMEGPGASLIESERAKRAVTNQPLVVESDEAQEAKRKADKAAKEQRLVKQKLREELQEKRRKKVNDMLMANELAAIKRWKALAAVQAKHGKHEQQQHDKKKQSHGSKQAMARLSALRRNRREQERSMEARRKLREILAPQREEERQRLKALRQYIPPPGTPQVRAWAEKPKSPKKRKQKAAKPQKEQKPPMSAAAAAAARAAIIAHNEEFKTPIPAKKVEEEEEEDEEYYSDDDEEGPRFVSSKINQHDDGW